MELLVDKCKILQCILLSSSRGFTTHRLLEQKTSFIFSTSSQLLYVVMRWKSRAPRTLSPSWNILRPTHTLSLSLYLSVGWQDVHLAPGACWMRARFSGGGSCPGMGDPLHRLLWAGRLWKRSAFLWQVSGLLPFWCTSNLPGHGHYLMYPLPILWCRQKIFC